MMADRFTRWSLLLVLGLFFLAGTAFSQTTGGTYYLCGNTWFSPAYSANGVHYTVVPAP
jgi:hypothetical protein